VSIELKHNELEEKDRNEDNKTTDVLIEGLFLKKQRDCS